MPPMPLAADLAQLDLFSGCDTDSVETLAGVLTTRLFAADDVVIRQDDVAKWFLIVLDGKVVVTRADDGSARSLGVAGRGSILGELSMLGDHPRLATITALEPTRVATGDATAFAALLDTPGMVDRLVEIAARRLAVSARPVEVPLPDGTELVLRPLLPTDRADLVATLDRQSEESLRQRFFTGGQPSPSVVDRLVDINYVDHFAWAVGADGRGIAAARYVRLNDDRSTAEVAFFVDEQFRGRGVCRTLLGALAAAAQQANITTFVGHVLDDNVPMRAVFDRAGAEWSNEEPGVLGGRVPVAAAARLIDAASLTALGEAAADVVTASGLALTRDD